MSSSRQHVLSVRGDKKRRAADDYYVTPERAVVGMLSIEDVIGPAWEPACGDGSIVRVLRKRKIKTFASDIVDRGCPVSRSGVDFLKHPGMPTKVRTIITNPPYREAQKFVETALSYDVEKVVMLMRLLWLEGKSRRDFFWETKLTRVLVHSSRINVARNGYEGKPDGTGGMVAFAWFVWKRNYRGEPIIRWIP